LNFNCPAELLLERQKAACIANGQTLSDDELGAMEAKCNEYFEGTSELVQFYTKMGKIKNINCNSSPEDVYRNIQEALKPNLIFVIGPTCVGKSELAQEMARHMSYAYMDVDTLFKVNGWTTCESKVKGLINFMEFCKHKSYVLDGFPQTRKQAKIFTETFCEPLKLLHVHLDKDEVKNRMVHAYSDPAQITAKTAEYNFWLQNKNELVGCVEKCGYYQKLSGLADKRTVFKNAMKNFNPSL